MCLLTLPLMYSSQGVACIIFFAKLLVLSLGAASSRSAGAVLRPAIFCFLVCLAVFLLSGIFRQRFARRISSLVSSHAVA